MVEVVVVVVVEIVERTMEMEVEVISGVTVAVAGTRMVTL